MFKANCDAHFATSGECPLWRRMPLWRMPLWRMPLYNFECPL